MVKESRDHSIVLVGEMALQDLCIERQSIICYLILSLLFYLVSLSCCKFPD